MYVKLVETLCGEHPNKLIKADDKKLGERSGLCKTDQEGKPQKVAGCSCGVVKDSSKEAEAKDITGEHFKSKKWINENSGSFKTKQNKAKQNDLFTVWIRVVASNYGMWIISPLLCLIPSSCVKVLTLAWQSTSVFGAGIEEIKLKQSLWGMDLNSIWLVRNPLEESLHTQRSARRK